MTEKIRYFQPKLQDLMFPNDGIIKAATLGLEHEGDMAVEESQITTFCQGCDYFKEGTPCRLAGSNDQARYAARGWCGWAKVDGEATEKTG